MLTYIYKDNEQHGPFEDQEVIASLQNGSVSADDLAWRDGFEEWTRLGSLYPSAERPEMTPPPLPVAPQTNQPVPAIRAEKKRKGEFVGWGAAVQAIGLLLCFTIVGAIVGIPLLIIGGRMAIKLLCSHCGNETTKEAKICSTCGAHFVSQSFTPQKKPLQRRALLTSVVVIASAIVFFAILSSIVSPRKQKELTLDNPQAEPRGGVELLADAESALRKAEFTRGADSLNRISSQYPETVQSDTVRDLALFLRDGDITQTGPMTVTEARRLRSLMVELDNIRTSYRRATPEKRRALEAIFGRETFETANTGLDSLSNSATKLREARDTALAEQR